MDVGREGHSGLYTMHFSTVFPPEKAGAEKAGGAAANASSSSSSPPAAGATAAAAAPATTAAAAATVVSVGSKPGTSSSPSCSLSQFSQWHILIRMDVENEMFFVKGDAKVFSPTPSLTSGTARGINRDGTAAQSTTAPDGIPIVPVHQKDRRCSVVIGSFYRQGEGLDGASAVPPSSMLGLEVRMPHLEAEVLGLSEPETLKDVVLNCSGNKSCGWYMGAVTVTVEGKAVETPQTVRFLLKPFYGHRCASCLDPVYAIGYTCERCEVPHYCSRECMNAHMKKHHKLLCPILYERYRYQSGEVVTEVPDGSALVAWWRCLEQGAFNVLVDPNNSLGYGIELTLNVLKSVRQEGLQYRLVTPSSLTTFPPHEEVARFACVLLREVSRSAILEGCAPLAAACLDYLYVFSPSADFAIQAHILFFTTFHCEDLDVPIDTFEEYVSFARPLHALASLQINYALKSTIPAEFWRRVKIAKDSIASLLAVTNVVPSGGVEGLKEIITAQQRDALMMLSKIFVMMATRAPQGECQRWLEQAERCLMQCQNGLGTTNSAEVDAVICYRLSALLLLYKTDTKTEEARQQKKRGDSFLKLRQKSMNDEISMQQQNGVEEGEQAKEKRQ
ncbi:hypothetical protein ABB37_01416 [Leptomonas pyrrhocoris]|uniref:MYND-type domain-containing protein n=1 Tax=Leptomonas pyrrhocoris TaxID=157538 RepID=A0A0M9G8I9_LEPPY|nr:hypothetical protein ABB37_01416 [Leptomonas pyrrhocoris]KPA84980.1 hypothetical protein ABB37_01416 [Leptomonas pyrrhocoris]|eukprot:XP_015663419.1 hypothetical protein ABB37_01416 [Leptomonas pyrrhocoris]